ncbi:MAG: hypothetical protein JWQ71_1320 [Pedosphaera sp.]|nr:hypothetical protein [Pedosphaera sp.]
MKQNVSYFLLGIVLCAVGIYVFGARLGFVERGATHPSGSSILSSKVLTNGVDKTEMVGPGVNTLVKSGFDFERQIADTAFLLSVTELLGAGRNRDASTMLELRLNGNIMVMDQTIAIASLDLQLTGSNLLHRIAEVRRRNPVKLQDNLVPLGSDESASINAQVNSTLERYRGR